MNDIRPPALILRCKCLFKLNYFITYCKLINVYFECYSMLFVPFSTIRLVNFKLHVTCYLLLCCWRNLLWILPRCLRFLFLCTYLLIFFLQHFATKPEVVICLVIWLLKDTDMFVATYEVVLFDVYLYIYCNLFGKDCFKETDLNWFQWLVLISKFQPILASITINPLIIIYF